MEYLMPSILQNADQTEEECRGPLSNVMVEGTPNLAIHPVKRAPAQAAVKIP
jgi:hypothetical protein